MYGFGQVSFSTDTGGMGVDLNTTGVPVGSGAGPQLDSVLNAIAKQNCVATPGSIWNDTAKSCQGDGSGSFGPAPVTSAAAGSMLGAVGIGLAVLVVALMLGGGHR